MKAARRGEGGPLALLGWCAADLGKFRRTFEHTT